MPMGLTYVRGRVEASDTESGTLITRVAGQFTSPLLACPVRVASTHRVQLPVTSSQITPTAGAMCIWFTPDNANGGGAQPASGVVASWYTDANNLIEVIYNKASSRFELTRKASGVGTTLNIAATFAANTGYCLYVAWSATTLYGGWNGAAIVSSADANIPTLAATVDIGSRAAASDFEARYDAVAMFTAAVTNAQYVSLAALATLRPPLMCEYAGTAMSLLWYGCHSRVWTLSSTATAMDLLNTSGLVIQSLAGAGMAPVLHRAVLTPLRDGAAYVDSKLQPRVLTLSALTAAGSTVAAQYALRRSLIAAMNPRAGQGLVMFAPATTIYDIDAIAESGLGYDSPDTPFHAFHPISFICNDAAWRVSGLTESLQAVPLAGWTFPWSFPWPWSPSSITFSLTNAGDLDAYPVFVVSPTANAATGIQFLNNTTGKLFKLSASTFSLAVGRVLTVDMNARTATLDDATNEMGYRSAASQMWPLVPGVNSITISTDSGDLTAVVRPPTRLVGV